MAPIAFKIYTCGVESDSFVPFHLIISVPLYFQYGLPEEYARCRLWVNEQIDTIYLAKFIAGSTGKISESDSGEETN